MIVTRTLSKPKYFICYQQKSLRYEMFLICKENKQKTKTTKQNNTKQKRKEKGTAIHRYYDNL
jgi:hypothetical protein